MDQEESCYPVEIGAMKEREAGTETKIRAPTYSELRHPSTPFMLSPFTAAILACDELLPPIGISKLLEFLLLFKDGSWFVGTAGEERTELEAWVEETVRVEGLVIATE